MSSLCTELNNPDENMKWVINKSKTPDYSTSYLLRYDYYIPNPTEVLTLKPILDNLEYQLKEMLEKKRPDCPGYFKF
ncbi:hypothetical protein CEXT_92041 [Caerostris extrusa]|uniref:Uncharacterized protein n=1 Tax=Caerostris extrusa TaxID=172846 RepID=A0AAV4MG42_CAEEX|nr:hypothetical protein CEXT_92041 [Caerostris extrusa]